MNTTEQMLSIPLYRLFYIENIESYHEMEAWEANRYFSTYGDKLEGIVKALAWAEENPSYNFQNIVPGCPVSNKQIIRYFKIVHRDLAKAIKEDQMNP